MIATTVIPSLAAAFWALVATTWLSIAAFCALELKGVRDKRKGDTFSETWWWLRGHLPWLFRVLMGLLVVLLLMMAGAVYEGFHWLIPHFLWGGH